MATLAPSFVLAILIPWLAHAQPQPLDPEAKKTAVRLLQEGIDRFSAADYPAALARFQAAYELVPSPKIFLNIGNALGKLGRDAEAADAYERFLIGTARAADVGAQKRAIAEHELDRLRRGLGRLWISVADHLATMTLDGRATEVPSDRPLYVPPGHHVLGMGLPGHPFKVRELEIVAGEEKHLSLSFDATPASVSEAQILTARPDPSAGHAKRLIGLVTAGVGVAILGVGLYFGLQASSKADDLTHRFDMPTAWRPEDGALAAEQEDAKNRATILMVAGGVAAAVGGAFYYWGYREGKAEEPVRLRASIVPGGGTLSLRGRF